ncbi:MAG: hypothetical protein IT324_30100 [Anaerolineae bacterium]|nr:hypothetical protein [Anaerolineae bacterium]
MERRQSLIVKHRYWLTFGLIVAIGMIVRWLVLRGANWRIEYDEGMIGLQAVRILRGELSVFLPGQPYLGNLESYLLAGCFALFGANNPTLKLVPLVFSGAYIGTTGLVAREAFGRRIGLLAALLAAFAPVYPLALGLKAWGAYIETLALGNLLLWITTRILTSPPPSMRGGWPHPLTPSLRSGEGELGGYDSPINGRGNGRRDWLVLALLVGVAFWLSWLCAFYVIPIALIILLRRDMRLSALRNLPLMAIAFLIGSLPFWLYNVQHPLATFTFLLGGDKGSSLGNAPRILRHFALDLAPRLVSGDPAWHILDQPAVLVVLAIYAAGLGILVITRKRRDGWLLTAFVLCFLPIYIFSGFGNNALIIPGLDATGRYVLMLHSVLPIGVALLARYRWGLVAIVVVLALNLVGVTRIDPTPVFASPYYRNQPATLQPLIDLLDQRGIRHIWTDVGIAQVLMFETHERILAADYYDTYYAHGLVRFPDVVDAVAKADRVAFVELIQPGQTDTPIDRAFTAAGIAYERLTPTPQLLVIIPRARVDPAQVLAGLGFQF